MKESLDQHLRSLYSNDKNEQGASYQYLIKATEEPVDWAYDIWNPLLDLLENGNNRGRSIAAQLLCNLAKSDPENRINEDLPKLFEATKDEKFVTARHSLLALWKVGIVNKNLTDKTINGLEKRFKECLKEKNCTLIRYDITCVLRKIYDHTGDEKIFKKTIGLIETETDEKYRKKYSKVWNGLLKEKK